MKIHVNIGLEPLIHGKTGTLHATTHLAGFRRVTAHVPTIIIPRMPDMNLGHQSTELQVSLSVSTKIIAMGPNSDMHFNCIFNSRRYAIISQYFLLILVLFIACICVCIRIFVVYLFLNTTLGLNT